MPERLRFIGLGIMGKPMALRLLQAGYELSVNSRSRPPSDELIVGAGRMAVAEARTLARQAGVGVARVRGALPGGFAQSRVLDVHGQRMIERTFEPGYRIKLHHKDLNIALAGSGAYGVLLKES